MIPPPKYLQKIQRWANDNDIEWAIDHYDRPSGKCCFYRLRPRDPTARVIFAHGMGNDGLFAMLDVFKRCSTHNLEIFSFDLDGHGHASSTTLIPKAASSIVEAAVDQAQRHSPLPIHLLGHSFGGALCLDYCNRKRPTLRSLTILATPVNASTNGPSLPLLLSEMQSIMRPGLWQAARSYGPLHVIPGIGPFFRKRYPIRIDAAQARGFAYIEVFKGVLSSLALDKIAWQIPFPTLLLYGGNDSIATIDHGRELSVKLSPSTLSIFDRETHYSLPFAPMVHHTMIEFLLKNNR